MQKRAPLAFPTSRSAAMSPVEISGATLWVRDTGEVWTIESGLVSDREGRKCFNIDWAVASWSEFLDRAPRHSLEHGGTGPFHLRLGVPRPKRPVVPSAIVQV
jgi:hypothetical protein